MAPAFKPAYLIHGDDHGRIAERRARLRAVAEGQSGIGGVELFEGESSTPENITAALNAMTFAIGRRFLIVDGVERWKEKELEQLISVLAQMPPDTTVAFFAREDGRLKASPALITAVKKAGGHVDVEQGVKPWELPKWVINQARELKLNLTPDAARTLVAGVGERQQRLLRELEKLALDLVEGDEPVDVDTDTVIELTAVSAERKAWSLADAMVSGDVAKATITYLRLRNQGERLAGLTYTIGNRLRQAHEAAVALEAGRSAAQVKQTLRMPPKAADQMLSDVRRIGAVHLRRSIERLADLELASRGGASAGISEDTHALLTIREIAAV
jgi:DNA polymerase-3 subunit delta